MIQVPQSLKAVTIWMRANQLVSFFSEPRTLCHITPFKFNYLEYISHKMRSLFYEDFFLCQLQIFKNTLFSNTHYGSVRRKWRTCKLLFSDIPLHPQMQTRALRFSSTLYYSLIFHLLLLISSDLFFNNLYTCWICL